MEMFTLPVDVSYCFSHEASGLNDVRCLLKSNNCRQYILYDLRHDLGEDDYKKIAGWIKDEEFKGDTKVAASDVYFLMEDGETVAIVIRASEAVPGFIFKRCVSG